MRHVLALHQHLSHLFQVVLHLCAVITFGQFVFDVELVVFHVGEKTLLEKRIARQTAHKQHYCCPDHHKAVAQANAHYFVEHVVGLTLVCLSFAHLGM